MCVYIYSILLYILIPLDLDCAGQRVYALSDNKVVILVYSS